MKKSTLIALFTCVCVLGAYAQPANPPHFYPSTGMKILYDANGIPGLSGYDTLRNPYTGGMNNPMFSNIDLNHDGLQDLFVFDREDNKVLTFLAHVKGSTTYIYAPQYEGCFPAGYNYANLVDYNHDGKPDLFTRHLQDGSDYNNALSLFKNVTQAGKNPSFQLVYTGIKATDNTDTQSIVNVWNGSNAVFTDIDHDGKVDLLTIPEFQTQVNYYRNMSKDPEKLDLYYWDKCWMKFQETLPQTYVPYSCDETGTNRKGPGKRSSAHNNVTINVYDVDGDSDMDLLRGDGNDNQLSLFTNGVNDGGHHFTNTDTMIDVRRGYPNNKPIAIYEMPYPSFVDVDNDHRTDIVVAASQSLYPYTDATHNNGHFDKYNTIWYYHNDMDTTKGKHIPLFLYQQSNFLQNMTFDMGLASSPCFADVNGDGYPDLLVASWGGAENNKARDHIALYIGDKKNHTFTPANNDFLNLSSDTNLFNKLSPAVGDLDGDNIADMVMGNQYGSIGFYKGTGAGTSKQLYNDAFELKTYSLQYLNIKTGQMAPINLSKDSKPAVVDIDGDGKKDLLIGYGGNAIHASLAYYKNTGNDADGIPQFQLITTTFGKVDAVANTAPCVADFDRDGKPDLIMGTKLNGIHYYHDITDNVDSLIPRDSLFKNMTTGQFDGQNALGYYLSPAAAQLNDDSIPDLMIGTVRGGLYYMSSKNDGYRWLGSRVGLAENIQPELMKGTVFPNPASTSLSFRYQDAPQGERANIMITDIVGRQILTRSIILQSAGQEYFDLQNISNGLYIFNVMGSNGQSLLNEKVIIQK